MKYILSLCLVLLCQNVHAAEMPNYDIKAFCKDVAEMAGGSAQIELTCRKTEEAAKLAIAEIDAPDRAVQTCLSLGEFSPSYQIYETCLKLEIQAIQELQ